MPEVLGRNRPRRRIGWFDLGASVLFLVIGLLLLARVLWHILEHHELLPKTLISGVLFCSVAAMFAVQGLKSKPPPRQRLRGKISKRNRRIRLFLLLCVLSSSSQAQMGPPDEARSLQEGSSSPCTTISFDSEKMAERQKRMKHRSERALSADPGAVERERKVGLQLAIQIDKQAGFGGDTLTRAYVSGLVQQLVHQSDAGFPFSVKIIDSDEINVFSLPGGFLYVTTGLLQSTDTEAQLVGLLGHEIAHVLARHGTRQRKKQTILTWVSTPLMFVGPVGSLVRQVAGAALPLKFSRDAELEADLIGIDLMYATGYDPVEYVRWLESAVPCADKPSRIVRMFDSYPVFQERLLLIQSRIADLPTHSEYRVSTSEFDEVRARTLRLRGPRLGRDSGRPVLLRRARQ